MIMKRSKLASILILVLCAVFMLAACSGGAAPEAPAADTQPADTPAAAEPSPEAPAAEAQEPAPADDAPADGKLSIGMVPKTIGHPYYQTCAIGASQAQEDFDVNVLYNGPSVEDINKQVTIIEDMITQKVDAIIVAPVDSEAIKPVFQKATDAGIPVFTFDLDAPDSARLFCITAANAEESGAAIGESLAKAIDYEGEVAILTGGLGQEILNRRATAVEERLKEWPEIEVVALEASDEDFQKCVAQVENLLQTYPNLKAIAGVSTGNIPAAASTVEAAGRDVVVTGIGMPSMNAEYIHNGTIPELILWDPAAMAYVAIKAAIDYVNDGTLPADGQDYGFGGKITVADGESIAYIPSIVFDDSNVDNYTF